MPEDVKKEAEGKEREEEEETEESQDTSEVIKKDASELAAILSKNPEIEQHVREILDYHLKESVDRTTLKTVNDSLKILIGVGAARLIVASCTISKNEFFDRFEKDSEGPVMDRGLPFLRHLTALYGSKVKEAYVLSREIPEDLRSATILYLKGEEKAWFMDAYLTKYNREKFFLRMSPASVFGLAQALIEEMGKLPREAVEEGVIKAFRERTEGFKKKFLSDNGDRD